MSLCLSELLKDIPVHSQVQVQSSTLKVGRLLGFCQIEMRSEDGQLLARGSHIKHLPMGQWWDVMAGPHGPSYLQLAEVAEARDKAGVLGSLARLVMGKPHDGGEQHERLLQGDEAGGVLRALNLSLLLPYQQQQRFRLDCMQTENKSSPRGAGVVCAVNPVGSLHGGALAIAAEQAALLTSPGE